MTIAEDLYEEGFQEGIALHIKEMINECVKRAIQKERVKMVRRLLSNGIEIALIAKVTDLSIEQIEELKHDFFY
jgi:predicted transposase/invertase (TIGR01784 family)